MTDAYDHLTKEDCDLSVLSKIQRVRTVALTMAIKYHEYAIIKDAEYLREIKRDSNALVTPLTEMMVVNTARAFTKFLLGDEDSGIEQMQIGDEHVRAEIMGEDDD